MLIQEMRSLAADNEITIVQDSQDPMAQSTRNQKDNFYDFISDDESTSESSVVRSLAADNEITVVQDSQDPTAQSTRNKKDNFYDFISDDESTYI